MTQVVWNQCVPRDESQGRDAVVVQVPNVKAGFDKAFSYVQNEYLAGNHEGQIQISFNPIARIWYLSLVTYNGLLWSQARVFEEDVVDTGPRQNNIVDLREIV